MKDATSSQVCRPVLVSQDSLDELEMNDYWKEVENIASSEAGAGRGDSQAEGEAQDDEQQKIPEGRIRTVRGYKCKIDECKCENDLAFIRLDSEKNRFQLGLDRKRER